MHYAAVVVIAKGDDPDEAVAKAMAPYDENITEDGWWDWWQIGGRYTGFWSGYDPSTDTDNIETCPLCGGTGTRPGGVERFGQEWADWCGGCNGCEGKGARVKFAGDWKRHDGDVLPVQHGLNAEVRMPFTVVTPLGAWRREVWTDGEWVDTPEWHRVVREALTPHADQVAVIVDYHS